MSEQNRLTRILEGLATQAIWQFLISAGLLSLGIGWFKYAGRILTAALSVFLVVVGLAGIAWVLWIVLRRKKSYAKTDIVDKILVVPEPTAPMIYINQHREAIDIPYLTLKNFSEVEIELEPTDVQITGSARTFGFTRAQFNPSRVRGQGGQSQVMLAFYNLTPKDVEFIETTCKRPGYFDLNLSLTLRVKTSAGSFDVPLGVMVRAGVQRF